MLLSLHNHESPQILLLPNNAKGIVVYNIQIHFTYFYHFSRPYFTLWIVQKHRSNLGNPKWTQLPKVDLEFLFLPQVSIEESFNHHKK